MRPAGSVAVVTGGASGIGRALCLALAAQDAAGVVVADLDGAGAAQVAAEIEAGGHRALAVTADVSSAADVEALVKQAESTFGRIDLFCSNAGIVSRGGIEVPDTAWERSWAVNVHAHVYVARAVVPGMLARGGGYLMITAFHRRPADRAGLRPVRGHQARRGRAGRMARDHLRRPGPQGVLSVPAGDPHQPGRDQPQARPARPSRRLRSARAAPSGRPRWTAFTADQAAQTILEGLADERFLILPHPEVAVYEQRRAQDRDRWLRGMRRFRARLFSTPPPGGEQGA